MLLALLAVQLVLLLAIVALYLRKPPAPAQDPRQLQLPDQLTRLEAQFERQLGQIRGDLAAEAATTRTANDHAAAALRAEVLSTISTLTQTLTHGLETFRADNSASAAALRASIQQTLDTLTQRFTAFTSESARTQLETQNTLHSKLADLALSNSAHQEKLRASVETSLGTLSMTNAAKLEEMRATVDEKLHATLHTRLTESFGQVTDQLNKVHTGLGEMSKLSEGVDGLSRIFNNVKSRGTLAEVMLGKIIEQILAPSQFVRNANVKPSTREVVEYAVRFPGATGETLLAIDSKFPKEDWEQLESAYLAADKKDIKAAQDAFESAIRKCAKDICEKYINEPVTTPYALMYLPTESLYAEVLRRDGLQADLQKSYHVMVAGPSNLAAILVSFQMGFYILNLQKKGSDVWKVLAATRTEFEKFGDLMGSMEKQVGTVQNTIQKLGVRSRAIHKSLKDVGEVDGEASNVLAFEEFSGVAPLLAAESGEDQAG